MLNQVFIAGKLSNIVHNKNNTIITLLSSKNVKNEDGVYEKFNVDVILTGNIVEKTKKYCKKNDYISVKCHIDTIEEDNKRIINLIADSIVLLQSVQLENKDVK